MTIKELQKICHKQAIDKGFWLNTHRNNGELIALIHSELSEALEAMRNDNWSNKDGVAEEIADATIRIMDFCEARDIDLEKEIINKLEYNRGRPKRHGKEF